MYSQLSLAKTMEGKEEFAVQMYIVRFKKQIASVIEEEGLQFLVDILVLNFGSLYVDDIPFK